MYEKKAAIWSFSMAIAVISSGLVALLSSLLFRMMVSYGLNTLIFSNFIWDILEAISSVISPCIVFIGGIILTIALNTQYLDSEPFGKLEWRNCVCSAVFGSIAIVVALFIFYSLIIAIVYGVLLAILIISLWLVVRSLS